MICRESDPTIDLHCPNEAWFRSPPGVPDSERIGRDTLNDHKRHLFNLYYIILFLKVKPRSCLIVTLFMLFYLVYAKTPCFNMSNLNINNAPLLIE